MLPAVLIAVATSTRRALTLLTWPDESSPDDSRPEAYGLQPAIVDPTAITPAWNIVTAAEEAASMPTVLLSVGTEHSDNAALLRSLLVSNAQLRWHLILAGDPSALYRVLALLDSCLQELEALGGGTLGWRFGLLPLQYMRREQSAPRQGSALTIFVTELLPQAMQSASTAKCSVSCTLCHGPRC
mmetsp:Transcript_7653/g.20103  ORF Transcript_7653/g.20103 Transcript_7653/m.20103 type:complete len:185 (-) Transcript_7653:79-633(-)